MDYIFKYILLGDASVGKSNILLRYTKNQFCGEMNPTLGFEFFSKDISCGDKKVKLQLWDTAGQERFRSLTKQYYKNIKGIVLVYDITKPKSFENLSKWISECATNLGESNLPPVVVVGNKKDLTDERIITREKAQEFATEKGYYFFETSAKDNSDMSIEQVFDLLTKRIVDENENIEKTTKLNPGEKLKMKKKDNGLDKRNQSSACFC